MKNVEIKPPPRVVAFYLPQFYQTSYNDDWWGPGFTEWTNVTAATPAFKGHLQPRLPGHLGFYDTTAPGTLGKQVALAKQYGVDAFCFYHYWFNGERLLEKPLDIFLEDNLSFPFMISWANENWTATWDGGNNRVLKRQDYSANFEAQFIRDSIKYLQHPDYVRDGGFPVLVVYRPEDLPQPSKSLEKMRREAIALGLPGLKILAVKSFGTSDPSDVGADGLIELPPLHFGEAKALHAVERTRDWNGGLFDVRRAALVSVTKSTPNFRWYRGVMPSWDNTPRRPSDSTVFVNESPDLFKAWLTHHLVWERRHRDPAKETGLVFINAWNEWAEGAVLEPTRHGGFEYLQAVLEAKADSERIDHEAFLKEAIWEMVNANQMDEASHAPDRKFIDLLSPGYLRGALNLIREDPTGRLLLDAARNFFRQTQEISSWKPRWIWEKNENDTLHLFDKLTIHAHVFHLDYLTRVQSKIRSLPDTVEWIISHEPGLERTLLSALGTYQNVKLIEVQNIGRNFGALMQVLQTITPREFILHLHSKKSAHQGSKRGAKWGTHLWNQLLDFETLGSALVALEYHPDVSVVYSAAEDLLPSRGYTWGANSEFGRDFCRRLGLPFVNSRFPYPGGGMFLARAMDLKDILRRINLSIRQMPAEPLAVDGTVAHALERLIGYESWVRGKQHLVITRDALLTTDTSFIHVTNKWD